jgi:hypothetical protein
MSAVNNGPQISKSGLIFCLDAGNNKSYSSNRFQSYGSGLVTEDVTFSINGTGTFKRVATGTVIGGYKIKPNDVVYSYALGVNGCHYHGNSVYAVAGVYPTFSFDYLVTGASTYPITDFLANFEGVGSGAIATANSLQNIWQRRSFTSLITSSAGSLNMYLYPGACGSLRLADSGTIYYRNPKVEFRNSDSGTSGYSSSKSVLTWYDISGNNYNSTFGLTTGPTFDYSGGGNLLFNGSTQEVTLPSNFNSGLTSGSWDFWVNCSSLPGSGAYQQIYIQEASVWLAIYNVGGGAFFGCDLHNGSGWFDGNGGNTTGAKTTSTLSANTWYNITYSWDGSNVRIYLNGSLQSTTSTLQAANGRQNVTSLGAGTTPRLIGSRSGSYFNGRIAVARSFNRALTTSEISLNYEIMKTRFGL